MIKEELKERTHLPLVYPEGSDINPTERPHFFRIVDMLQQQHLAGEIFVAGLTERNPGQELEEKSYFYPAEENEDEDTWQMRRTLSLSVSPRTPTYDIDQLTTFAADLFPNADADEYLLFGNTHREGISFPVWGFPEFAASATEHYHKTTDFNRSVSSKAKGKVLEMMKKHGKKITNIQYDLINITEIHVLPSPSYAKLVREIEQHMGTQKAIDSLGAELTEDQAKLLKKLRSQVSNRQIEKIQKEENANWSGGLEVIKDHAWLKAVLGISL